MVPILVLWWSFGVKCTKCVTRTILFHFISYQFLALYPDYNLLIRRKSASQLVTLLISIKSLCLTVACPRIWSTRSGHIFVMLVMCPLSLNPISNSSFRHFSLRCFLLNYISYITFQSLFSRFMICLIIRNLLWVSLHHKYQIPKISIRKDVVRFYTCDCI